MDLIKTSFTITDLENLTGIKKHTIRIWEKRYGLLSPQRSKTNIRSYDVKALTNLMNLALLNNNGFKIAKIAALTKEEVIKHCEELVDEKIVKNHFYNQLKVSMLQFDQALFEEVYTELIEKFSFRKIYRQYFIPLLGDIGMLWQTETINPAHEHFITALIRQKIILAQESTNTETEKRQDLKFVLFLPSNEIHDIGLAYLNYELQNAGFQVIFLGQSISIEYLTPFARKSDGKLIYMSYFTVKPELNKLNQYLIDFKNDILKDTNSELWILGQLVQKIDSNDLPIGIKKFKDLDDFLSMLKK